MTFTPRRVRAACRDCGTGVLRAGAVPPRGRLAAARLLRHVGQDWRGSRPFWARPPRALVSPASEFQQEPGRDGLASTPFDPDRACRAAVQREMAGDGDVCHNACPAAGAGRPVVALHRAQAAVGHQGRTVGAGLRLFGGCELGRVRPADVAGRRGALPDRPRAAAPSAQFPAGGGRAGRRVLGGGLRPHQRRLRLPRQPRMAGAAALPRRPLHHAAAVRDHVHPQLHGRRCASGPAAVAGPPSRMAGARPRRRTGGARAGRAPSASTTTAPSSSAG